MSDSNAPNPPSYEALRDAADARRYRAFFEAGLPITFMGQEYRSKDDLDRAIDAFVALQAPMRAVSA